MFIHTAAPIKFTVFYVLTAVSGLVAIEFSPSDITSVTIAAGSLVAIVFAGIVNIIVALRRVDKKIDDNTKLTTKTATELTQVSEKANAIGDNVDGLKTKADAKIDAQEREIMALKQSLTEEKQRAALLAQSAASAGKSGA